MGGRGQVVSFWRVYERPRDHPGEYVARRFQVAGYPRSPAVATDDILTAPTLDELRAKMPAGRFRLVRGAQDAPDVVEVWL